MEEKPKQIKGVGKPASPVLDRLGVIVPGTDSKSDVRLTQRRSAFDRRLDREARALEIVKAVRPKGHPEHPETIALMAAPFPHTALPGIDPDAPGMVYFLYAAGFIKIGYTTDMAQRLGVFHTHSPMPVTLLLTVGGSPEDESNYHEMFAADRLRPDREWFRLSLDLRDFLGSHFGHGTLDLLENAEDEAREMFDIAREYWVQLSVEEAEEEHT